MKEHVHEYQWDEDVDGVQFLSCRSGCTDTMFPNEILKRVNATERLNAEDAMPTYDMVMAHYGNDTDFDPFTVSQVVHLWRKTNRAYAEILEGKP